MLLRHIHYFLAVAEHGGFTRAASALHVSQPALSQQIRQLEERLGTPLFDRCARPVRLTDAGEAWAVYARRALRDLAEGERAIQDVAELHRGALRLALNPTFTHYLLGPLTGAFYRRYPAIALEVQEMTQEQMEQQLLADRLDVAIGFAPPGCADIEAAPLRTETLALVTGRHAPLPDMPEVARDRLNDRALVLLSSDFATRQQIDLACRQHNLRPHVAMECSSVSAIIEIIRSTPLATLLPASIAHERNDLRVQTLVPPLLQRTAVVMRRKEGYQTAAARAITELLSAHWQE